jgi:hypothetical protein
VKGDKIMRNIKIEQDEQGEINRDRAVTRTFPLTGWRACQFSGTALLFLRVTHAQDEQILVLEIVARDGVAVCKHLAIVRQDKPPSR